MMPRTMMPRGSRDPVNARRGDAAVPGVPYDQRGVVSRTIAHTKVLPPGRGKIPDSSSPGWYGDTQDERRSSPF